MTSFESLERRINFFQHNNSLKNDFKNILRDLGFVFSDRNLVKFPDTKYLNNLKYVLKCLNIIQSNLMLNSYVLI
jgi:hypothetical protein